MESHSCEKNRGEGVASRISTSNLDADVSITHVGEIDLCQYIGPSGRRCRMPVASASQAMPFEDGTSVLLSHLTAELCGYHAQRLAQRQRASQTAAAELLASAGDFTDPVSVNRFLGKLVEQVALKRIPRRDGIALAYICQLLLNSLGAIDRKEVLRLEQARLDAARVPKQPPRVIWDLPLKTPASEPPVGPPVEPAVGPPIENDSQTPGAKLDQGTPPPSPDCCPQTGYPQRPSPADSGVASRLWLEKIDGAIAGRRNSVPGREPSSSPAWHHLYAARHRPYKYRA